MKAIDMVCPVCLSAVDVVCDLDFGTGFEPVMGRFHMARVRAAARHEREGNLAKRALQRKDQP